MSIAGLAAQQREDEDGLSNAEVPLILMFIFSLTSAAVFAYLTYNPYFYISYHYVRLL